MRRALTGALLLVLAGSAWAETTQLRARGAGGRRIDLQAELQDDAWLIRVRPSGQAFLIPTDAPDLAPALKPLAADGIDDLLVATDDATDNVVWQVWLQDPASGRFAQAGQVSGLDVRRDRWGYVVTLSREGCCAWTYGFQRVSATRQLEDAFAITVHTRAEGGPEGCEVTAPAGQTFKPAEQTLLGLYCGPRPPGLPLR